MIQFVANWKLVLGVEALTLKWWVLWLLIGDKVLRVPLLLPNTETGAPPLEWEAVAGEALFQLGEGKTTGEHCFLVDEKPTG